MAQVAPFTICMATYGQPLMMEVWWENLRNFTSGLRDLVRMIVVDDHGDPPLVIPEDLRGQVRGFRIHEDIPWNDTGARNLAIQHVATPMMLTADPDMVFEEEVLWRMLQMHIPARTIVRPYLRHLKTGKLDDCSPNIYWIRKSDMEVAGCYDEDFAGHYGWGDVSLMHTFRLLRYRDLRDQAIWAWFYDPETVADSCVTKLDRELATNKRIHEEKMRMLRKLGGFRYAEQRRAAQRCRFTYSPI